MKMLVACRTNRSRRHRAIGAGLLLICTFPLKGCGNLGAKPTGPASTDTTSAAYPTLQERIEFLQCYVRFRRNYESLDFTIKFQNNSGGMVPGPTYWDIRLVAVVPESEIAAWIPASVTASSVNPDKSLVNVDGVVLEWPKTLPTSLDLSGINEWYRDGPVIVGLDRARRIVAYRNLVY